MIDFEIQRCTRQCAKTERTLVPGEEIHSVLVPDGSKVVRLDFSLEGFEGPPENAITVWKCRIPEPNSKKVHWAPNDVMLEYFTRIADDVEKQDTRYVLALLLLRRRVLQMSEAETSDADNQLLLHCPRNDTEHVVRIVDPDAARTRQIQDELAALLFGGGR